MAIPLTLIPCIPEGSSRYQPPSKRVTPAERLISPAMFSSSLEPLPMYEPIEWTRTVHPEGAVYFYMNQPKSDDGRGFCIVTDDDAQEPSSVSRLAPWVATITQLTRKHKSFPSHHPHLELYLRVDEEDFCSYYFVDRKAKTIFFFEEHSSLELGLESTVSDDHLRLSLERQFWIHTEFFPCHFGGLAKGELDELMGQFRHGSIDQITSLSSTFPYEADKCLEIIPVLESIRQHHLRAENINRGYDVAIIARFASVLMNTRIQTHYGERVCRLDRHVSIIASEEDEIQWTKPIISTLTLGFSDLHLKKLDDLFVDSYVYNQQWARRIQECVREWTYTGVAACVLLALHALFITLDVQSTLAKTSAAFSAISILSAALLVLRHESLESIYEGNGYNHLSSIRSDVIGFQGVALGFAIPKATLVISLFTFLSQGLYLLLKDVDLVYRLPWITVVGMFLWIFNLLTSPTQRVFAFRWFNRQKAETSMA
ncbi:hypothetical protein CVT24_009129 [Panaeolus cyanescens]|uniref:Uncharacterized protein n=1 Tax=Panaeolus cyanescens TaxID=181874 RepID=A0A409WCT9_9AGAR|nr:hypothetical protein CVT24_009129 [Panaeolus cyanescens]